MEQRLTEAQLAQIVAEVEQLSQRQQAELDTAQVKEILEELNLPTEFLEEAVVQLHRREALAVQQRRNRWIAGSAVGFIASLMVGGFLFSQSRGRPLQQVVAQRDRITLAQDTGGHLNTVTPQTVEEVFYRVTLAEAPVGRELTLSCRWIDPSGVIVHQNNYQTQELTTPVWQTYCRHTIGSEAPTGTWEVQMFLDDRRLSDTTFNVQ